MQTTLTITALSMPFIGRTASDFMELYIREVLTLTQPNRVVKEWLRWLVG